MQLIHVSAGLLTDPRRRLLLVRKHGTTAYMQPGGKQEPGESPDQALVRELAEEVGLDVSLARLQPLGRFRAPAANEPGHLVVAHAYRVRLSHPEADGVQRAAEIADAVWVPPLVALELELAPLTREHLLPIVLAEVTAHWRD